jgi:hypothetical protein
MPQYSNEFGSIIKQLRKISANTCAESEQMPYYEKEVCGTLPDVEGQTSQYTLIRVYTRDIDTGQIVLSHYEDTLGNIISGTVVEACCDSAVCGPPFTCAANIVGLSVDTEEGGMLLDITGTTMTGYLQWMIDGVVQDTFPNPGINTLLIDIASEIIAGGITISLLVGNNVDMDMYCMFSFETLADLKTDIKELGDDENWNPFPALTASLGCTGTLTYTLILDATENGITVDYTTGELTLPAGIYDSYAFVEVRCDGVLVAVAGLQLLNEAPGGFRLEWDDIANSPFTDHTDLNAFITLNSGTSNYTSMSINGDAQIFSGGSNVDLGDDFMNTDLHIVSIIDEGLSVIAQGNRCQFNCPNLVWIELGALITQGGDIANNGNQRGNPTLTTILLNSLQTQGAGNQRSNGELTVFEANSLITQTNGNQYNNQILPQISLPSLVSQTYDNQNNNALLDGIFLASLETQTHTNQRSNDQLTTLTLEALTTQGDGNQCYNDMLTTFTANLLTVQGNDNQTDNRHVTVIDTPLLATIGTGNYVGSTFGGLTINVAAALTGEPDILLAQAGGAIVNFI